ncbi:MAG: FAD:protein FMN transferase [Bacteroidia bacterium]|nr:FAD:protein FMN transferase [Bacteroidia bacterium]
MRTTFERNIKGSLTCLFFVFFFLGCSGTKEEAGINKLEGNALGTTYHITYMGPVNEYLTAQIDSTLLGFNQALSTYHPTSLISKYNNNEAVVEDFESEAIGLLHLMIKKSMTISSLTDGAFDPGSAALFALYSEAKKKGVYMDSVEVAEVLRHSGIDKVSIEKHWTGNLPVKLDSFVQLNFNAIAKGYFVDLLAHLLDSVGSQHYMVEVGGEVRTKGKNPSGKPWRIGINRPQIGASANDFFEVLELTNQSMATSGNYQNYYEVDGKVIGHTLDPRSGKPVITNLKSATIMHEECAVADAFATACMVLGVEKSTKLIESNPELSGYLIYEEEGELKGIHIK